MSDTPKPFFDVLNNILEGKESESNTDNPWDNLSSSGYQPNINESTVEGTDPNEFNYSDFVNKAQKRTQGFNIIDVNPYLLSSSFALQIPISKIYEKIGYQGESDINGGQGTDGFWRTLEFPVVGNFLKFEYLPSQINSLNSQNNATNFNVNTFFKTPNFSSQLLGIIGNSLVDNKVAFIQFEDTSNPLYILKHGDTFELSFTRVFIHVRQINSRFSLVFGNNAKISNASDNRVHNANLALGPGIGLWESTTRHPIPFCFSISDADASTFEIVFATTHRFYHLVNNSATTNLPGAGFIKGFAVGWITGLSFICVARSTNSGGRASFSIYKGYGSGPVFNNKTYLTIPINLPVPGAGIQSQYTYNEDYSTPIRFSLDFDSDGKEQLLGDMYNPSSIDMEFQFQLRGYVWGRLSQKGASSNNWNMEALLDAPFPLDIEK